MARSRSGTWSYQSISVARTVPVLRSNSCRVSKCVASSHAESIGIASRISASVATDERPLVTSSAMTHSLPVALLSRTKAAP